MYQNRNKELEILALFIGGYDRQFYLREISKLARLPLKTTQNLTAYLEKNRIMKGSMRGKNKYFKLNLDNVKTKLYLIQTELHKTALFTDKYPVFKPFMKGIRTNTPLIVFGSFAEFKADKASDLDLLVISKEKQALPFYLLPYNVHLIELSETSFVKALEKKEALVGEVGEKHIILNNHSFFVNTMWNWYGKR